MSKNPPRIVCAAIRNQGVGLIICGPRHYDEIMRGQIRHLIETEIEEREWTERTWRGCHGDNQGFVDQYGKYYTRAEALVIAMANGQRLKRCGGDETQLFSENLY